ncbi:MAG: hypothetical protein IBX61_02105 [Thermoleophilia bacterium]|nr:hypothetical protein [Thermoleophilia bacterium]
MTTAGRILSLIRAEIAADTPLLGNALLTPARTEDAGYSDLFTAARDAAGPSCSDGDGLYLAGLEYIFEGYLLHIGASRLLAPPDGGFALLAGDYMYARGLNRVARLEDPVPIDMLADLIRTCAVISCEGLEPGLGLNAWSATTLKLAAHAAGSKGSGLAGPLNPEGGLEAQARGILKDADGQAESLLLKFPEPAAGKLRVILNELYSSFNN